jgi:hypothetical protein
MTLVEAQKRYQNPLVSGVAETIVTADQFQGLIPLVAIAGNGITFQSEATVGNAAFADYNADISATNLSTRDTETVVLTRIIGEATLDKLMQMAHNTGSAEDLMAAEIRSKAKDITNKVGAGNITGNGTYPNLKGLFAQVTSGQSLVNATSRAVTFDLIDELLDKVDGDKFLVMNSGMFRKIKALYRSFGGITPDYVQLGGLSLPSYDGKPIFINDNIGVAEAADGSALTGGTSTSIYCGRFDDGTLKHGLAVIYPSASEAGIVVEPVGVHATKDADSVRVKRYLGLGLFNSKGLARLGSLNK